MAGIIGRTLAKDFHQLLKNIHGMSGGQVVVTDWEDDLTSIKLTITPTDGYYKGGQYQFVIKPSRDQDFGVPPRVYCDTMIYHPNIDTLEDDGELCLNLLEDDMWTEDRNLEDVVQGILFLLYNPNLEDPLCCIISPDMSEEEFEENVKISIAGGCIDGYHFQKPKIRGEECKDEVEVLKTGDGDSGDTLQVREEPDGAEDVTVQVGNEGGEEHEGKIREEIKIVNRINSAGFEDVISSKFEPECNVVNADEGTSVDPPYGQNKLSNNANVISTKIEDCIDIDKTGLNSNLGEESDGKLVPRFNFWLGIAIRRVRTWNVFWL